MRGWSYNVLYVYRRTANANDDDDDAPVCRISVLFISEVFSLSGAGEWVTPPSPVTVSQSAGMMYGADEGSTSSPSTHYRSFRLSGQSVALVPTTKPEQPRKNVKSYRITNTIQATHSQKKPRTRQMTDRAWFSRRIRHPTIKRIGPILSTSELFRVKTQFSSIHRYAVIRAFGCIDF